jgi:hypothetical protein
MTPAALLRHPRWGLFDFGSDRTRGEAAFMRVLETYIVASCISFAWTWGAGIPDLVDVVFPLGLAHYVGVEALYNAAFAYGNAAAVSVLLAAGLVRATRWAYPVGALLLHLQFVTRFSQGFDPHGSHLLGMTLVAFALAPFVFPDARRQDRFALGMTYFFLGLGYTLAAWSKLIGTGLHWAEGAHMQHWIAEKSLDAFAASGVYALNALQQAALDHAWVATGFLVIGLVTEFTAFLAWLRPLRHLVALGVLGLHLGIFAVMGILSTFVIPQLVLLAFPWARWIDGWLARRGGAHETAPPPERLVPS